MAKERYTSKELRMLIACFIAYTAAYISRTNLSPALEAIRASFGLTAAQVGLLPTCFALPYAFGQVGVGFLADKLPPPKLMITGLLGSALMNLLFSFSGVFPLLLLIWLLNGIFQSMIWTPIVKTFACDFRDSVRGRCMFQISMTLIVGYLCAWAISGFLTTRFSWQTAFRTSGAITAVLGFGAFLTMRDAGRTGSAAAEKKTASAAPTISVIRLLTGTNLIFVLICCFFNGYIRDSIMNWAAKLLVDTQGIDLSSAVGVILIIPIVNFIGIQAGKLTYYRMGSNNYRAIGTMMICCAAFAAVLAVGYTVNTYLCIVMLALCSAVSYGINPLLTSFMPMEFIDTNRVGLAAGLIDALIYVGSAFSGTFAGFLSDQMGWGMVFASWAVFGVLAAAAVGIAGKYRLRRPKGV